MPGPLLRPPSPALRLPPDRQAAILRRHRDAHQRRGERAAARLAVRGRRRARCWRARVRRPGARVWASPCSVEQQQAWNKASACTAAAAGAQFEGVPWLLPHLLSQVQSMTRAHVQWTCALHARCCMEQAGHLALAPDVGNRRTAWRALRDVCLSLCLEAPAFHCTMLKSRENILAIHPGCRSRAWQRSPPTALEWTGSSSSTLPACKVQAHSQRAQQVPCTPSCMLRFVSRARSVASPTT
jgi:hypothetical protein